MKKRLALLPFGLVAVSSVSMAMAPLSEPEVIDIPRDAIQIVTTTSSTTTTTTTTTVPPTTTTTIPSGDWHCPEWIGLAISVGWPEEQLAKMDTVMYRESRCNHDSHNPYDPMSGSYGLMQVNGYWCSVVKYNPIGWLQEQGILYTCTDLFDPTTNLRAALLIWNRSGWSAWSTA